MVGLKFDDEQPPSGGKRLRLNFEDEAQPAEPAQPLTQLDVSPTGAEPVQVPQGTTPPPRETIAAEESTFGLDMPGGGVQATAAEAGGLPELKGTAREVAGGATFEFADEGEAFVRSAFSDRSTSDILSEIRKERQQFREQNPKLATAANIGGAMATIAVPATAAAKAATLAGKAARGAGVGGVSGAAAGAGAAEGGLEERLEGAKRGAQVGATVGAALPGIGRVAGEARKLFRSATDRAQTLEQLENLARLAYERAERAGVVLKPSAMRDFVNNIGPKALREIHPRRTPKAFSILRDWERLSGAQVGMKTLMDERALVNRLIRETTDATDRRALGKLRDSLDGFIDNLDANTVARGDTTAARAALKEANNTYRKFARGEVVDRIIRESIENAKQGGIDREIRRRFKQLMRNEKQFRLFNKREKQAIRKAARLGVLSGPLAVVGTAAPRGFFSGVGQGATIVATGQPALLAIPAAGETARQAVNVATRRRAQQAFETATGRARPARTAGEQAAVNTVVLGQIPETAAAGQARQRRRLTTGRTP